MDVRYLLLLILLASCMPSGQVSKGNLATDGTGSVTSFWVQYNHNLNDPLTTDGTDNARIDVLDLRHSSSAIRINTICATLESPGTCNLHQTFGAGSSYSNGPPAAFSLAPLAPVAVPTLQEWALILFGLILAGGAALYIQRRQIAV